jgi:hypothetical protein
MKLRAQISTYGDHDILQLLNYHNQELTLYHLLEIRNPSVLEEAEELEPELVRDRDWTLTEGPGLTDAGVKVFEDVTGANSEQQQLDKEI